MTFQDLLEAAKNRQRQTGRDVNEKWAAVNREASVASTSTLRNPTPAEFGFREILNDLSMLDDPMDIDLPGQDIPDELEAREGNNTLIVATDFGTTFSSVAFAAWCKGSISEVKTISNYPEDPMILQKKSLQVPTESGYPVKQNPNESIEECEESLQETAVVDAENPEQHSDETDDTGSDEDDDDDPYGIYGDSTDDMDLGVQQDQIDDNAPYWGYDVISQARRANIGRDAETEVKFITRSKLMVSFPLLKMLMYSSNILPHSWTRVLLL